MEGVKLAKVGGAYLVKAILYHEKTPSSIGISSVVAGERYWLSGVFLSISFLLAFVKLAEEVLSNELLVFDQVVTGYINLLNGSIMTQVMQGITVMGSAVTLILLALITICYFGRFLNHDFVMNMIIVALAGSWLANEFLKWVFQRSRPPELMRLIDATGYSFPSGHAMVSFAFYGLLIYLLWFNLGSGKLKYFWAVFLSVLVLAIGMSRIYLGVHYPSDVVAGFAAGGVWLVGCILCFRSLHNYRVPRYTGQRFTRGEADLSTNINTKADLNI